MSELEISPTSPIDDVDTTSIWHEGYNAYDGDNLDGKHANPYPENSIAHEIWNEGYEDAIEDDRKF